MGLVPDNPPVRGCLSSSQIVPYAVSSAPGGICTHDLAIWPHTLAAELQECVSPPKWRQNIRSAATSERVRRKKKGLSCILLGRLSPCRPIYQEVPLVALLTACHFGMILLYHVFLALGRHLFFEIQIFGDQICKLLADSL